MARQITIITPEDIPLTLEPAGLARRFGALLIDLLIQVGFLLALLLLASALDAAGMGIARTISPRSGSPSSIVIGIAIMGAFAIFNGYYILFEGIWSGQTPGKRVFRLRVLTDTGAPVGFGAVATRNMIRIVDFLPVSYAAGAISLFFHPQYKRLGDIVAGTLVIKEQESIGLPVFRRKAKEQYPEPGPSALPPGTLDPRIVLTSDERELLRRFASRRWQMTSDDSERLAYRLVAPLVTRLNLTFVEGALPRYADLVTALVAAGEVEEAREQVPSP